MTNVLRALIAAALLLVVWLALDLLAMLFAGLLLAIFLRTLATWLADATGLSVGRALAVVVLALAGSAGLAAWMYAPNLADQSDQLTQKLPQAGADLASWLRQYTWGRWLLDQLSSGASNGDVTRRAATALNSLIRGGVAVVVILFTGLYLAAEPTVYVRGFLHLIPPRHRLRAAETLYASAHVLRWWLVGQALAMTVVGLAMGIGLAVIGVELAFLLGVLAGLFEFVPLVGPLIALGPALLMALAGGTQQALYVLVLYGIVQAAESYVLTPLVQRKAIKLPPVITISAQVALSWAAGPVGLLIAVPLTAVVLVSTQTLYVQDQLGDRVAPEFAREGEKEVEQARMKSLHGLFPDELPPRESDQRSGT